MNRRDAMKALALPVAAMSMGAGRGMEPASEDVPFSHTLENGDRCADVDHGCNQWDDPIERVFNARTDREIERVFGLNWDTPWVDYYPEEGVELKRLFVPFYVETTSGARHRSANGD